MEAKNVYIWTRFDNLEICIFKCFYNKNLLKQFWKKIKPDI